MTNQFRALAMTFGLAVTAMAPSLMAQDSTVMVPFAYEVGATHMDAGRTNISMASHLKSVVQITNSETGRSIFTGIVAPTGNQTSPRLVFHRYGSHYFLVEAALTSGDYKLPVSKAEKEFAMNIQNGKPEVVYLALR